MPGNERPHSSAERTTPTTPARTCVPPHTGQTQSRVVRAHHRHTSAPPSDPPRSADPPGSPDPVSSRGPAQRPHRSPWRQRRHCRAVAYPPRGTDTSTGPLSRASAATRWAARGTRAWTSRGSAGSGTTIRGAPARRRALSGEMSFSRPVRTHAWVRTDRDRDISARAAPVASALSRATMALSQPGECGSTWPSSPSSHTSSSPGRATGAKTAERVPTATRARPVRTRRNSRQRADGPRPWCRTARPEGSSRPALSTAAHASTAFTSGSTTTTSRPEATTARTATRTVGHGSTSRGSRTAVRGPWPAAARRRKASPPTHADHPPAAEPTGTSPGTSPGTPPGTSPGTSPAAPPDVSTGSATRVLSAVAWRGGTAERSTSTRVPAVASATTRARAATSAVSGGTGVTTRRTGRSPVSGPSVTASTQPSSARPAKGTCTRAPATAPSTSAGGTA